MNMNASVSRASAPTALFQGYNSVLGLGRSTAVAGKETVLTPTTKVVCSVSSTIKDLARSLNFEESMAVAYGPFADINEKARFLAKLKATQYSVSVTIYARHDTNVMELTDPTFTSNVTIPTDDQSADAFVNSFGDSFVSRIAKGGEYFAVYTFYTQNPTEQSLLLNGLKSNGIFDGVSVNKALQEALTKFLEDVNVNFALRQMSTGWHDSRLPMPNGIVEFAIQFETLVPDAPVVTSISPTGYEKVPNAGTGFEKIARNRRYFNGFGADKGLSERLSDIILARNQMVWISELYTYYGGFDDETLVDNDKLANSDIEAIEKQMTQFESSATKEYVPLPLPSLSKGTPELRFEVKLTEQWGKNGGQPFNDVNIDRFVRDRNRITAIGLRSGARTDQLRTTYISGDGTSLTKTHGQPGGSDLGTLQLLPGQFVTKVWGRAADRVDQVNFELSDRRTIGGTGGGGEPFSWIPPKGSFVMGFKGRAENEVDALQVYYCQFQKADWINGRQTD